MFYFFTRFADVIGFEDDDQLAKRAWNTVVSPIGFVCILLDFMMPVWLLALAGVGPLAIASALPGAWRWLGVALALPFLGAYTWIMATYFSHRMRADGPAPNSPEA